MDPLEEQLKQLQIINNRHMPTPCEVGHEKVAAIAKAIEEKTKLPPIPPKPLKKNSFPEVPQSSIVKHVCEPLYSQRLQCSDGATPSPSILFRRPQAYVSGGANSFYERTSKVTLDNPAILEQQLEALAHHKKQLERKGLLPQEKQSHSATSYHTAKLPAESLIDNEDVPKNHHHLVYANLRSSSKSACQGVSNKHGNLSNDLYTNMPFESNNYFGLQGKREGAQQISSLSLDSSRKILESNEDEITAPPSPVSSSYSELRRATDVFTGKEKSILQQIESANHDGGFTAHDACDAANLEQTSNRQTYANINNQFNNYSVLQPNSINNDCSDYYGFGGFSQESSTYESIYEPINPRTPSQQSARSNFLMYSPYAVSAKLSDGTLNNVSTSASLMSMGNVNGSTNLYPSNDVSSSDTFHSQREEVDVLTDYLVNSLNTNDADNYGICYKCNERVLGENNGCTAMDQIYHISCFTCSQCQINLQGKPFYAIEGKPYCEYDYLQTLEKCSVCMKPILERILRATGKPYHPQCFTCVVCSNSLDGVPFTVDATNQNYCIADFHKKFAPRCCVCKEPIMPDPGEEETVRVVALDRSFHFECYKCEDCGLLLSSEAEGRGCYPLDGHVLCKCCNAKRVQMLTNKMTTQL